MDTFIKSIKYWKNASGMKFKQYGLVNRTIKDMLADKFGKEKMRLKAQRKLAAFILQGKEACFIHHLTILCDLNGIPVYKNEHDGLITGKPIKEDLVKEAAQLSGLKNPVLEEKPLISEEKKQKLMDYLTS